MIRNDYFGWAVCEDTRHFPIVPNPPCFFNCDTWDTHISTFQSPFWLSSWFFFGRGILIQPHFSIICQLFSVNRRKGSNHIFYPDRWVDKGQEKISTDTLKPKYGQVQNKMKRVVSIGVLPPLDHPPPGKDWQCWEEWFNKNRQYNKLHL